jgi:hypothetical protein
MGWLELSPLLLGPLGLAGAIAVAAGCRRLGRFSTP